MTDLRMADAAILKFPNSANCFQIIKYITPKEFAIRHPQIRHLIFGF